MNKRLATLAILAAAVAAAAGFTRASNSAWEPPNCGGIPWGCEVTLTPTGPSPRTLTMYAKGNVRFVTGAADHTVVFANGLCSFTVEYGHGSQGCKDPFMYYAGSYAYTVDGKFPGTVITTPLRRSVTLTGRSHTIRAGTRLTLRGQVHRSDPESAPPPPVVVLARHNDSQPFEPAATVRTQGSHQTSNGWKLVVRPEASTTYIAEVTGQRVCYFPASRCAHPQGQIWANAKSRPFTVRIRQEGPR